MEGMKEMFKSIITERLQGAPESAAKGELIEELTDNLACRYEDLVRSGIDPDEARAQAVDALGDTNELVEYLTGMEPDQPLPELVLDPDRPDDGKLDDLLHNVEDLIRGALRKAKTVICDTKDTIRENFDSAGAPETPDERAAVEDAPADEEDPADAVRAELAEIEQKLAELEEKKADAEERIDRLQERIDEAENEISQLESTRDSLEDLSDKVDVSHTPSSLNERLETRQRELSAMEAELGALEELQDSLETEFDELEEQRDRLEEEVDEADDDGDTRRNWSIDIDMNGIKTNIKGLMNDIEVVIRDAVGTVRTTADKAAGFVREAASAGTPVAADLPVDADRLQGIDVQTLGGGDITVRMNQDPDGDVVITGDPDSLEVFRTDDGVLKIRPVKTETSSFFSRRGIFSSGSASDVTLDIPCRHWPSLRLQTGGGDIRVEGSESVADVTVSSLSGDIEVRLPSCGSAVCRSTNGDIDWTGSGADFRMESVSGDLAFRGSADALTAKTTSGDVTAEGSFVGAVSVKSVSGDLCVRSCCLPDKLDMGTTSGDMWVELPDRDPFTARFRSTAGEFTSDFFRSGMRGRNCVFNYLGGGAREYTFSSISGDLELRKHT